MDQRLRRTNCLDIWTEENSDIINKWKISERSREGTLQQRDDIRKRCYVEIHKLLQKIQGVPSVTASIQLELTVLYNTLLFALSLSEFTEMRVLLTQGLVRALEAQGCQVPAAEATALWQTTLQAFTGTGHLTCLHQLLCVQWALWLCTGQLESFHDLLSENQKQMTSPSEDLLGVMRDLRFSIQTNSALSVAMAPKELKELLSICTVTRKGIRKMEEGKDSEALLAFYEAVSQPAPRSLLAQLHTLTGICLAKLGRPQSAMQCYRKALQVDFSCRSALYQSALLYRQLGNAQAETEALRLLHKAASLPSCGESSSPQTPLLSSDSLLCCQALSCFLANPSPPGIQHALAQRCLHSERIPEAVEHYLDLLASLQSDGKLLVNMSGSPALPRIPEIYLEAAFTMLKAKRYWDAVTICEEILDKTADLVPERLVLELPAEEHQEPSSATLTGPLPGGNHETVEERLNCILWVGASYLLQGQAHGCMKNNTEAVTHFTRSINLLVKVHIKHKDWQCRDPGDWDGAGVKVQILQRLKGLALAGRGVCLMHCGQQREALRDLQQSLQAFPGVEETELWLMEALWRLGRKEAAMAHWRRRTEGSSKRNAPIENTPRGLPLYLQCNLQDVVCIDPEGLKKKMEDLDHRRGVQT